MYEGRLDLVSIYPSPSGSGHTSPHDPTIALTPCLPPGHLAGDPIGNTFLCLGRFLQRLRRNAFPNSKSSSVLTRVGGEDGIGFSFSPGDAGPLLGRGAAGSLAPRRPWRTSSPARLPPGNGRLSGPTREEGISAEQLIDW